MLFLFFLGILFIFSVHTVVCSTTVAFDRVRFHMRPQSAALFFVVDRMSGGEPLSSGTTIREDTGVFSINVMQGVLNGAREG